MSTVPYKEMKPEDKKEKREEADEYSEDSDNEYIPRNKRQKQIGPPATFMFNET